MLHDEAGQLANPTSTLHSPSPPHRHVPRRGTFVTIKTMKVAGCDSGTILGEGLGAQESGSAAERCIRLADDLRPIPRFRPRSPGHSPGSRASGLSLARARRPRSQGFHIGRTPVQPHRRAMSFRTRPRAASRPDFRNSTGESANSAILRPMKWWIFGPCLSGAVWSAARPPCLHWRHAGRCVHVRALQRKLQGRPGTLRPGARRRTSGCVVPGSSSATWEARRAAHRSRACDLPRRA